MLFKELTDDLNKKKKKNNNNNNKNTDCDAVFIEIPDKNIIVGIVYKPDYFDYEDFISQIEAALNTITKEKKRGFIII